MNVGVVGDGPLADRIRDAVEGHEAAVAFDSAGDAVAADPESVVAVGEAALLALVREGVSAPVLPISAGPGYGGVPDTGAAGETTDGTAADEAAADGTSAAEAGTDGSGALAAVEALLGGEYDTETRTVLGVSVGGERVGRALADAMLVTSEPARISEYAVHSRDERVARFRADGVVVSTPTGSHGYGRSAGGPVIEPGPGVVGVAAVAPFAVDLDHWVLAADEPVALTVERDEGEVELLVDDRTVRSVPPGTPVELVADGALELVRTPDSRPFFER